MILNNFKKVLWGSICNVVTTDIGIILPTGDSLTNNGVPYIAKCIILNYDGGNTVAASTNANYIIYQYLSLAFGSGTTEPTADDYQMESPYDTTNHFQWENQVQSYVLDTFMKVITASITNISEEDLTVSEIGVVLTAYSGANSIFIARSLITPVTISVNETKTFQYNLDLSGITE